MEEGNDDDKDDAMRSDEDQTPSHQIGSGQHWIPLSRSRHHEHGVGVGVGVGNGVGLVRDIWNGKERGREGRRRHTTQFLRIGRSRRRSRTRIPPWAAEEASSSSLFHCSCLFFLLAQLSSGEMACTNANEKLQMESEIASGISNSVALASLFIKTGAKGASVSPPRGLETS